MHDVLIAGAGIAGLATGLALARAGHQVTVLERAAQLSEAGAGIQLGPNAVRTLECLGLWQAIEPLTVRPEKIVIRDGLTGKVLSVLVLKERFERRFGAPYRVMHRGDLLAILANVADKCPGLTVITGEDLQHLTVEDRTVLATTSTDEFHARLLIGADGIRSTVRQHVAPGADARPTGHGLYRACPELTTGKPREVGLWLLPGAHVVHYPVSGGRRLNLVACIDRSTSAEGWSESAPAREVRGHLSQACLELKDMVNRAGQWTRWAGAQTPELDTWINGPVCLVGDAAHAALPFLAQGAAMALEDAVVLAACLERQPLAAGLMAYQHARKKRTARHLRAARRQGRIYHLSGPARLARNLALRLGPEAAPLSRLAWLYDWQPPVSHQAILPGGH